MDIIVTMADRRAVNKYYPPDWDPSKGSINTYKKAHPLRDRARLIDKGILVVRFEMPFSVWCSECDNLIGAGVRFNAEKSKVGSYYTTPVYQFIMKCHLCGNRLELHTDPAKFDYIVKKGARRQARMCDKPDEAGSLILNVDSAEEAKRRVTDSMFKLEKRIEDRMKAEAEAPNLVEVKKWRDRFADSFSMNQLVRSHFRSSRKRIELAKLRDKKLLKKYSLDIKLATPRTEDTKLAKQIVSKVIVGKVNQGELTRRNQLKNSTDYLARRSKKTSFSSQLG